MRRDVLHSIRAGLHIRVPRVGLQALPDLERPARRSADKERDAAKPCPGPTIPNRAAEPGPKPGPKSGGKPGHHGPWGAPTPSNDAGEPAAAPSPAARAAKAPSAARRRRKTCWRCCAACAGASTRNSPRWRRIGRRVIPILMLLAVAVWALSGVYQVPDGPDGGRHRLRRFRPHGGPRLALSPADADRAANRLPTPLSCRRTSAARDRRRKA